MTKQIPLHFIAREWRFLNPPWNKSELIDSIFDGVKVKIETDPVRVAYFAAEASWGDIFLEPTEEQIETTLW